jgi:hypothetical protein
MTRGGRLPDPGLGALCAWPACGEPREAHGGESHYGACPGESGLYAKRFSIAAEDRPPPEPIVVRQARAVIPVSAEMLAEAQATGEAVRAYLALSDEERAARYAELEAGRRERLAVAEAAAGRFLEWLRAAVAPSPFAEAHREIIAEHQPIGGWDYSSFEGKICGTCSTVNDGDVEGDPYPCVTLRALARAYGWEAS